MWWKIKSQLKSTLFATPAYLNNIRKVSSREEAYIKYCVRLVSATYAVNKRIYN